MRLPMPAPAPPRPLEHAEPDALYPLETDEPMASSLSHSLAMQYAQLAMSYHLRDVKGLVAMDYIFYYRELPPGATGPGPAVTPDVMVVLGIAPPRDTSYRLWEVGKAPDLVMEMSSRAPHRQDQFHKHDLYAELGIREYWLHDPHGGYLEPRLQGWRLEAGLYQPIAGELRPELGAETFHSEVLGTHWGRLLVTDALRLWDEERDDWFLPPAEAEADRLHQTRRAEREARRADQEARRADQEARHAELETRRADQEARRADQEAQARAELEQEVARLQAQLKGNAEPEES